MRRQKNETPIGMDAKRMDANKGEEKDAEKENKIKRFHLNRKCTFHSFPKETLSILIRPVSVRTLRDAKNLLNANLPSHA